MAAAAGRVEPGAEAASRTSTASANRRRWAHVLLMLVGLVAIGYGLVGLAHPQISCRGVQMRPGDVCVKNDFDQLGSRQTQTYEQRLHAVRLSRPVVVVVGGLVFAFGVSLYRQDRPTRAA